MKKKKTMRLLLLIIAAIIYSNVKSQTQKVLFLGNSYTYVNDLPSLISNLAQADGKTLIYDQNTTGGYYLEGHSTNTTSLDKIASNDWDFVILQDQSQKPSFPPSQVATDVYPYAKILVDSIYAKNECTEALFFMTWGRQNGDQDNCPYYTPLCTYEGMQGRLRESYLEMGFDNMASVSPVGVAWKKTREITGDSINLYSSDESHPSIYGSYLAACVFYTSIFNASPVNNSFISTLSDTTAHLLQSIAYSVVTDSNYVWNFKTANFGVVDNGNMGIDFLSTDNYTSEEWDFGDGVVEAVHNPTHVYQNDGQYTVTHVVSGTCYSDTVFETITVVNTNTSIIGSNNLFVMYPNPVKEKLTIKGLGIDLVRVLNNLSVIVLESESNIIDLSTFEKGTYFIEIYTRNTRIVKKIIKL